jgi:two-component system, LytTR family, response regulator
MRSIIVDDEELARERLKRLLAGFGNDILVVGEAQNGDKAQEMIETLQPDVVFLDIQMPGKNIFTVLTELKHKPFVVFCTAFDHYALKAFETNTVDYLVKPIEEERLSVTIEKLKKIATQPLNAYSFQNMLEAFRKMETKPVLTSVHHKVGDKTILVKLEKVVLFETEDKCVHFYTFDGQRFLSDQSLKTLEEKLPDDFVRVSKSTIINRNLVKEIHRYFRGCVMFVMDDMKKTHITSGRNYTESIKRLFEL